MNFRRILALLVMGLACLVTGCGSEDALSFQNINNLVKMIFTAQPQTTTLGTTMPAIRLEGRDQYDQLIDISQGTVELRLANNPSGASLLENGAPVAVATQLVQNGMVTFTNLRVDQIGTGYTLEARYEVPGTLQVLTATSQAFDVTSPQVTSVFFLRSTLGLWDPNGGTTDRAALDSAFGAGNWTEANFTTVDVPNLLQGNRLVFMDGGDDGALEFDTFLTTNQQALRDFVSGGGRVIANAAPNVGANIVTPFGATIVYNSATTERNAVVVDALHPIGVACNGVLNFTGNSFGHALVVADDMTPIITGPAVMMRGRVLLESDNVVLAEGRLGAGLFLVGGMTTTNFHQPDPNSAELLANILRYAGGLNLVPATPAVPVRQEQPPGPSSRH